MIIIKSEINLKKIASYKPPSNSVVSGQRKVQENISPFSELKICDFHYFHEWRQTGWLTPLFLR
jgi:hypothetical protein